MKKLDFVMILAVFSLVFFGCDGTKLYLLVPENVKAEQAIIDGQIAVKLTWDPVTLASYYEVHRAGSDGRFEKIGESDGKKWESGKSFYDDKKIETGKTYRYKIRAMGVGDDVVASGFSEPSEPIAITVK